MYLAYNMENIDYKANVVFVSYSQSKLVDEKIS